MSEFFANIYFGSNTIHNAVTINIHGGNIHITNAVTVNIHGGNVSRSSRAHFGTYFFGLGTTVHNGMMVNIYGGDVLIHNGAMVNVYGGDVTIGNAVRINGPLRPRASDFTDQFRNLDTELERLNTLLNQQIRQRTTASGARVQRAAANIGIAQRNPNFIPPAPQIRVNGDLNANADVVERGFSA